MLKIYFDQNILSLDDKTLQDLSKLSEIQWVYSSEHYNEIARSEKSDVYINKLSILKPIKCKVNLQNNKLIDQASLIEVSDFKADYESFICGSYEVPTLTSFKIFRAWVNGGNYDELFAKVPSILNDEINNALTKCGLQHSIKSSSDIDFKLVINAMLQQGNNIEALRGFYGISKGNIGNLNSESALKQIYDLDIKSIPSLSLITSDQFFWFEQYDNGKFIKVPLQQGIIACCVMLDLLGYQAEKKCRKLEKIDNTHSDAVHIATAAFFNGLLSRDQRLINRAKAIYKYKKITTETIFI